MDRTLTFAGTDLGTFGANFTNGGSFPVPARDYERVEVLGRNGDILIDNGKFSNVKNTYPSFIYEDFREGYRDMIEFLSSKSGYQRIEDSLDPDMFRMGAYVGATNPSVKSSDTMASFELTFDCKPQRFFKQDEEGISLENAYSAANAISFSNPSVFTSKPLIKMYPNSQVYIRESDVSGGTGFSIKTEDWTQEVQFVNYIFIDCETLEIYSEGGQNMSAYVSFPVYTVGNEKFPFLIGEKEFKAYMASSSQQAVTIWPRWWTI